MRIDSSVTSLSWIPSEAVTGLNKAVFHTGFVHYDAPPPVAIDDLESLVDGEGDRSPDPGRCHRLILWGGKMERIGRIF